MGAENLTGQVLGQYELRALLGAGGMGAVYRAYQATLKREVAVKVLPMKLANEPGYMERFSREAQIAAALEHPHIVPILDYGTQRGISYVVMRLLTGGALSQRMQDREGTKQAMPSLGEVVDLLKQLGGALDYAHSQGVIHRDIKPSNVMFDNHGNSYLVDFGIAKLLQAVSKLTETGTTMGTPMYMSPEQWKAEELTSAADQYALGVMAYELVTGGLPFQAETPYGLMHKHLNERPTPVQNIRRDVPEAITEVLERVMAKDPADRFPNVTAFALAFESAVRGSEGHNTAFFTSKVKTLPSPAKKPTPLPTNADDATRIDQVRTITGGGNRSEYPTLRETGGQAKPFYLSPLVWVIGILLLVLVAGGIFVMSSSRQDDEESTLSSEQQSATIQASIAQTQTASVPVAIATAELTEEPIEAATEVPVPTMAIVELFTPSHTPANTEIPTNTTAPSETPTDTPQPTATFTETLAPSETPTSEPTAIPPSDTPQPPNTMLTEIAVVADESEPVLVFHDTFSGDAIAREAWDLWGAEPEVAKDYLVFEGAESYSDVVARYELTNNTGILIRFSHQPGYIDFLLESGEWETDSFASWGLKNDEDRWILSRASGAEGANFEEIISFQVHSDTWYSLLMWLNEDTELEVRLWEEGSSEYTLDETVSPPEGADWSDREWTMLQRVHHGLLLVDDYAEYSLPPDFELSENPAALNIPLPPISSVPATSDLVIDEPLTGQIEPGQTSTFTFIPQADGVVAVDLTSEAFDTLIEVRQVGTDYAIVNDDAIPGETTNSAIPVLIVQAGQRYQIAVRSYAEDQSGEYTLTISETALPEPVEIGEMDLLNNTLEAGTIILYSLEGSEGETISAYLLGEFDGVLELRRASGEMVTYDDDSGLERMPYLPYVTLPADDTYLLMVRGYDAGESGNYTLVFERGEFVLAELKPTEIGSPALGVVPQTMEASYSLQVSSAMSIEIEAEAHTLFEVTVTDLDANPLASITATEDENGLFYAYAMLDLEPGTYYIALLNHGDFDTPYALDVHVFELPVQVEITAFSVNLYREPSEDSEVVTTVIDVTLPVLGKTPDGLWLMVEYESEVVWVWNLLGTTQIIGDLENVPVIDD